MTIDIQHIISLRNVTITQRVLIVKPHKNFEIQKYNVNTKYTYDNTTWQKENGRKINQIQ